MSEASQPIAPSAVSPMPRARFSWPMRVFLFLIAFNMVFRSLSVLYPWGQWQDKLEMASYPTRLATQAEIEEKASESSYVGAVFADFMESADSTWEFFRPWPGAKTRAQIDSGWGIGQYAICWIITRYNFVESVLGVNQEWPMFSPNVSRRRYIARSELEFADGTKKIVRQTADPEDLTNYSHWFEEKVLDYELHVGEDAYRSSIAYCNLLANRHALNDQGSKLIKIRLFEVKYMFPPPDVDPVSFLREQTGPPANQVYPFYLEYDVATREGRKLPAP